MSEDFISGMVAEQSNKGKIFKRHECLHRVVSVFSRPGRRLILGPIFVHSNLTGSGALKRPNFLHYRRSNKSINF